MASLQSLGRNPYFTNAAFDPAARAVWTSIALSPTRRVFSRGWPRSSAMRRSPAGLGFFPPVVSPPTTERKKALEALGGEDFLSVKHGLVGEDGQILGSILHAERRQRGADFRI